MSSPQRGCVVKRKYPSDLTSIEGADGGGQIPTSAVCRRCFEPGVYQVGAIMEDVRLPLPRGACTRPSVAAPHRCTRLKLSPDITCSAGTLPVYSARTPKVKRSERWRSRQSGTTR